MSDPNTTTTPPAVAQTTNTTTTTNIGPKPTPTVVDAATLDPLFPHLSADDVDLQRASQLQSMCMNCHSDQGVTRMLMTRIPYFRDVIIMAFECPRCSYKSANVQPANETPAKGVRYTLHVDPEKQTMHTDDAGKEETSTHQDLNRQIIKSATARVYVPELEFVIPPAIEVKGATRDGDISTIEGILSNAADRLSEDQPARREGNAEMADKLQVVIDALKAMATGKRAFTIEIDDCAGDTYLENPDAPNPDQRCKVAHYDRSPEQERALGFYAQAEDATLNQQAAMNTAIALETDAAAASAPQHAIGDKSEQHHATGGALDIPGGSISHAEVVKQLVKVEAGAERQFDTYFDMTDKTAQLPGICHICQKPNETRMAITEIPYFKEVILMCTECENCGFRDNELKPGGSVSTLGRRVALKVTSAEDYKRDLLKSDTSGIEIPELKLQVTYGSLGGKYTTLEGILSDIRESLVAANPFGLGDSTAEQAGSNKMREFIERLDLLVKPEHFSPDKPFTFVLDDPMGNVFIQNPNYPEPDPNLTSEDYERTAEQNEEMGLNDMVTENYS